MRFSSFCLLATLLLAIIAGGALADQIRVKQPDGSVKDFDGVEVIQLQRDETGNGTFQIRMSNGAAHPVDLAQVVAISFGKAGEGRKFDLVVNTEDGPRPFVKSTLRHYSNGVFAAVAFGETDPSALPAANMIAISAAGSASSVPSNPDDLFGEESAMADEPADQSDAAAEAGASDAVAGSGSGGGGFGGRPDDPKEAWNQMMNQMRASGASPGLVLAFTVSILLYLALMTFTSIWLSIHAFTKGNIAFGLGIMAATAVSLFLCCCSPRLLGIGTLTKSFYMKQYETPYRPMMVGLVNAEVVVYLVMSVILWLV